MPSIVIHETFPSEIGSHRQVAVCCIAAQRHILLLQVMPGKLEELRWGFPGGKLENQETAVEAVEREVWEETGIQKLPNAPFFPFASWYIQREDFNYIIHIFGLQLEKPSPVRLSKEHRVYQWVLFDQVDQLPLMTGVREVLQKFRDKILL